MQMTADDALEKVNKLYRRLSLRRHDVTTLERYFRGEHPLAYASPEWRKIHEARYQGFSDNWCGVVGSAPAERTELFGFRLGSDADVLSDDERILWRDWELNDGPAQASQGFLMSTVAKRSFVTVWGDENDEPKMTWEHPSQMIVEYDDEGAGRRRESALKVWLGDDEEYATLYTATDVWKFERPSNAGEFIQMRSDSGAFVPTDISSGDGGWVPREEPGEVWPLPHPMGRVPVVEFPNRPMLGGEPMSDIAGTMAMQDAINMLWAYLFVAGDYASMPARVVMGQQPPKVPILDANGQQIGEKPVDIEALTKGRMLWLTGDTTKIDQWAPATLDVFTDIINVAVRHISAQTRTPIYLVHGELGNVNGETLTGLDAPLVSKVRESHKFYTSPMREVFNLFALVRGNATVADACRTGVAQWKNPEVRSDAQISDAALKDKQIGWPFASILEKRYGLAQPEIQRVMEMVKAEQADPYLSLLAAKGVNVRANAPSVG